MQLQTPVLYTLMYPEKGLQVLERYPHNSLIIGSLSFCLWRMRMRCIDLPAVTLSQRHPGTNKVALLRTRVLQQRVYAATA